MEKPVDSKEREGNLSRERARGTGRAVHARLLVFGLWCGERLLPGFAGCSGTSGLRRLWTQPSSNLLHLEHHLPDVPEASGAAPASRGLLEAGDRSATFTHDARRWLRLRPERRKAKFLPCREEREKSGCKAQAATLGQAGPARTRRKPPRMWMFGLEPPQDAPPTGTPTLTLQCGPLLNSIIRDLPRFTSANCKHTRLVPRGANLEDDLQQK